MYKPAPTQTYEDINREGQLIDQTLEIDEKIECMAKREAYVTLKDHKANFTSTLPCRLINPAKSEVGIVSKSILDNILTSIQQKRQLNLWKSISAVTDWFTRTQRKQQCTFVLFDIVDLILSINI